VAARGATTAGAGIALRASGRINRQDLVVEYVIGAATAALKPIDTDIHPVDSKAAAVYKTTPQGDLRINVYFPPNWKANDGRPAIVFFFAGSCATGNPAQFAATAEYFAARGLVATAPEYRIETSITRLRSAASRMARAPSVGSA
jgi:acetyl esterase/lipase